MNILIINPFYYPNVIGGTENSIQILAEGLVKRGCNVGVFTSDSRGKLTIEEINGVKVYRSSGRNVCSIIDIFKKNVGIFKKILFKAIDFRNYLVTKDLQYVLKDFNPDIVHTNNVFGVTPYVWKYIKKNKLRLVHTIRDYGIMCPKGYLLTKKSNICTYPHLACKIYRLYIKSLSKYVNFVTAASKFTLDLILKNGYFPNASSQYIYNSIEFDQEKLKNIINTKLDKDSQEVKFIFIGNLVKPRGIEFMINAFKKIGNENIKLIICGSGELENYVTEQAIDDDRIIFKGRVVGKQKEELINSCDVLIIPSMFQEPFGRVIIEAYKYGLPVIGTNLGGIPEIVKNYETGIIVNHVDENELVNAIKYFTERKNIKDMLKNIEETITRFGTETQIDLFLNIYKSKYSESDRKTSLTYNS